MGFRLTSQELIEAVRPTDKLQVIVALLEYIEGKDYQYLLQRVPSKTGIKSHYKYCFHHKDNNHNNNRFDNLVILSVEQHDAITHQKITLDKCEFIDLAKVIDSFKNTLNKDTSNTVEE